MKKISYFPVPAVFLRLIAIAGLLVLVSACVRERMEEELPVTPAQPEHVEVKLHLRASQPAGSTRGLTVDQENLINDVYVFFLNNKPDGTGTVHSVAKGRNVSPNTGDPANAKWTFTVSLTVNTGTSAAFDCLVLANAGGWMQGKNLTDFNGKSYGELQAMLVSDLLTPAGPLPGAVPTEGLVMWGKGLAPVTVPGTTASITVPVVRALASVEVGVGKGLTADNLPAWDGWDGNDASGVPIPFVLKKVYVYRPNNRYAFMPLATVYDPDGRKVTAPSPAGASAAIESPLEYPVTGHGIRRTIYLPEADIKQLTPGGAGHTGKPGDAGHTDRCALVVCGSYNNHSDTYYRIDFNDNAADRSLIDLLRNHRYYVTITSVNSDGEPSADEAYKSRLVNLGIEITGWTDQFQDIVFDGTDWMHAQKKSITLPGNAGQTGTIVMESTIAPGDWEMSFDGGITSDKSASVENTDFKVTKPTTTTGGTLKITTKVAMAENDPDRTATLTIKARRLSFTVNINQNPDKQTDWEQEGGDFDKDY